jgi:asparagine synthase (glutamine-hydrolysing)
MCGITGLLQLDQSSVGLPKLKLMASAIRHRGPDGEGYWLENQIGLAHLRLAIIDLSPGGHQPRQTKDGRYVITYNGEIYNYLQLRTELEAAGFQFYSNSDTEVLLIALAHWGMKALSRLNGMFTFALWDRQLQQLTLARDRYGIKPLYYASTERCFSFGSEIKAILADPVFTKKLDQEALVEYLTFQNIFSEKTMIEGIKLLPAGCYIQIDTAGKLKQTRYWDYSFHEPAISSSEDGYLEELSFLFQQSVARQMVGDVDIGAYLSGGMDSGSITALAAKHTPNIRTFTCGFDLSSASGMELSFDERAAAERMSYLFKTEQYEMVLKSGDMERVMSKLAHHIEEPRVGQSYPNFYIAQLASKFNKVVLAGTGGDELFGGYPWRYYRAVNNSSFDQYVDKYYQYWQRLLTPLELPQVLAPIWGSVKHVDSKEIFKDVFVNRVLSLKKPEDYVNHSLYFEAKTFLHGLLVVEDKLSMAHGLETRVPFLDNDLVDFAMRLPVNMKISNLAQVVRMDENETGNKTSKYFNRTNDGKILLRKVMGKILPRDIVDREKQGFSAPDASWFKGESIDFVKSALGNKHSALYKYLDFNTVQTLVNQHTQGTSNRRLLIWSLLSLNAMMISFDL